MPITVIRRVQARVPTTAAPAGWFWWGSEAGFAYARSAERQPLPYPWLVVRQRAELPPLAEGHFLQWAWDAPVTLNAEQAAQVATRAPKPEAYVVVIREIPEGGRYTVGLGVGKYAAEGNLPGIWDTVKAARDHATHVATTRYAQEVAEIVQARGGLHWGAPVPLALPLHVLVLQPKESSWVAYQRLLHGGTE